MSGGVDSSVAAAMLVERGHEVIGLTMQIWQESQRDPRHAGCCSLGAVEDARRTAASLGIAHYVVNLKEEFKRSVIDNFVDEYSRGRTPNPCIQCNRHVKFELLLQKLKEFDCDCLATGHYARIRRSPGNGPFRLLKSRARDKDQSYVLYMLGQEQLRQTRFPMGELESKAKARELARSLGLCTADKPESQDICFVSEAGGYREFLKKARPSLAEAGKIEDSSGHELGEHGSISEFTVGQRKGIRASSPKPLYILRIDPAEGKVVVGGQEELMADTALLEDVHCPSGSIPSEGIRVTAKVRYNMEGQPAVLYGGSQPRLEFIRPVRAIAPGQTAVAYRGQTVVAGGVIRDSARTPRMQGATVQPEPASLC